MLGIEAYVLRYWETEFPFLNPNKSRSGQRVYGEEELGLIRRIKELLYEEGYTIAGAKRKLEAELESGAIAPAEASAAPETAKTPARKRRPAPAEIPAPPPAETLEPIVEEGFAEEAMATVEMVEELGEPPELVLDSAAAEEIQRLRSGLQIALRRARDVLRLLEASA